MNPVETNTPRAEFAPRFTMNLGTLGIFLTLVWIFMFFAGLAGVYFFLFWENPPEKALRMPVWMWVSTVVIVISSLLLEWARHSLMRLRLEDYRRALQGTMAAGTAFVLSQGMACYDLYLQGAYEAGQAAGSVYYSFSGIHAVHLLGGLAGLYWLYGKARHVEDGEEQPLRRHRGYAKNVALYWHFMGIIWLGLFAFLLLWR
jgi:cytochrome c oxidase subunit III